MQQGPLRSVKDVPTRQHPPNAGPDVHPRELSCHAAPLRAWNGYPPLRGSLSTGRRARLVFRTRRRLGHRGLRFRRAGQRVQSQYGVYLGTAPRHIWVQSLSGTRLLCYGCRATATALPVVFVTVLLLTASGSARSDGSRALTTNHPYGPSLVVRNYLVWDATRRELWETALLSTTRRLPVREY